MQEFDYKKDAPLPLQGQEYNQDYECEEFNLKLYRGKGWTFYKFVCNIPRLFYPQIYQSEIKLSLKNQNQKEIGSFFVNLSNLNGFYESPSVRLLIADLFGPGIYTFWAKKINGSELMGSVEI